MTENTAGLLMEPDPAILDNYEQGPDGKWYWADKEPGCEERHLAAALGDKPCPDCGNDSWVSNSPSELARQEEEQVGDVNSDEKGSGARYNAGKPPMNYIPLRQQLIVWEKYNDVLSAQQKCVLEALAMFEIYELGACDVVGLLTLEDLSDSTFVWAYGAEKYAAFNWAKGMKWSIPLACISRHVQAILGGEITDPESGCSHWCHVVCNILILEHYENFYQEGDDRPPAEVFSNG
jgi:hypothetical protein